MTENARLLVIDDDEMQLELIERALSRDNFALAKASTLVEIAAARAFAPELVLVDVNMPEISIVDVFAAIREIAPDAKVMLHSAWEASRLRRLAAELGADGFVSKSESVFGLGATLRRLAASAS